MRTRFDKQLDCLHSQIIKMGALCEKAISLSVKALLDNDITLIKKVFETDDSIDAMEREIESECMRLLLSQQPVAGDLRTISSALKMISDIERIGDQASDIAELAEYLVNKDISSPVHIRQMAEAAVKMVSDSIHSFVNCDLELALATIRFDDEIDSLFESVKRELITIMTESNSQSEACLDLLMIAKYLERIGDHAENIAEWAEFSIIGIHRTDQRL